MAKKSEQAADSIATGLMWFGLLVLVIGVIVFYSMMTKEQRQATTKRKKSKKRTAEQLNSPDVIDVEVVEADDEVQSGDESVDEVEEVGDNDEV